MERYFTEKTPFCLAVAGFQESAAATENPAAASKVFAPPLATMACIEKG
jgi:hypothetical protein